MTCHDRQDLIIAHLLGTLDAPQERVLRDHLAHGCPACAGFTAEMTEVLGQLPLAQAHLATPPAGVRQQLMALVTLPPAAPPPVPPSMGGSAMSLMTRPLTLAQAAGIVAVLLVVGGLAASVAIVHQRGERAVRQAQVTCAIYEAQVIKLEDRVEALTLRLLATGELSSGQIADRDALIDELEAELTHSATTLARLKQAADTNQRVIDALHAGDLKFVALPPAAESAEQARIVLDPERDAWYLFTTGLPALEAGRVYQLWFLKPDQTKVSAGTFRVGLEGRGFLTGEIPGNLDQFSLAAITEEPAGGSDQPTGALRVAGEL